MARRIAIIQGHPDPANEHFCHALACSYAQSARAAGHEVRQIDVATLEFPLLRSKDDWENGIFPEALRRVQDTIAWAQHLLIVYPLWLGSMPAVLKGFLEQVLRPGFAVKFGPGGRWTKLLRGKTARVVVIMGMPALVYRWYFGAHGLKNLRRNILEFVGIGPVAETIIGSIETCGAARRSRWLDKVGALGRAAK